MAIAEKKTLRSRMSSYVSQRVGPGTRVLPPQQTQQMQALYEEYCAAVLKEEPKKTDEGQARRLRAKA
jgi:hypothetical protein